MEKTNLMAEFIITGDDFEPNLITEVTGIQPAGHYIKGEKVENKEIFYKETCWFISTNYQESLDINLQLNQLLSDLVPNIEKLNKLKSEYNLNFIFSFSIRIVDNQSPAIYLESDAIKAAYELNAEFDFDLYVF